MAKKKVTKSKTGKNNLGPEMAKKAADAKTAGKPGNRFGPYDPIWNPNPSGPKSTFNPKPGPERAIAVLSDDKPGQVKVIPKKNIPKPGATVIGHLARGAKAGGLPGLALGAIAAYKSGLKEDSKAKKKKNRMN